MYKDDLQAAKARADAAERRVKELLGKAKQARREKISHCVLAPFRWLRTCKNAHPNYIGVLKVTGITIACIFSVMFIGTCCYALQQDDKQKRNLQRCINSYCYKHCLKHKSLVTSRCKQIHGSYYSCTCHLKRGESMFNFTVPNRCRIH